jgi:hypothetical protein
LEINEVYKYDNPKYIFCYTHRINILSDKIIYLKNDFILITHNSPGLREFTPEFLKGQDQLSLIISTPF